MQAMILAAGLGKRMQPITNTIPKPLIKLHGEPLIVHMLKNLASCGIHEVVINTFYLKEQLQDFLQDGSKYGVQIVYSAETVLLDTGGGVVNALPLLDKQPFLLVSADIYTDCNFANLPSKLPGLAHIVLVNNPAFKARGDYALAGQQVAMSGTELLTYANIGVYSHEFFLDPPGTIFPLNMLLARAITSNRLTGEIFSGMWHNIGSMELLAAAEQEIVHAK